MTFELSRLVRENIRRLKPYSSARSEFTGTAEVFLDANENAFGSPAGGGYNRYPDPLQLALKSLISKSKGIATEEIFVGNGSDEAIDLLFRIFCNPSVDEVIICPPTYGMYRVSAEINDVTVMEVALTLEFGLDTSAILAAISERTKLVFICSPNNPTGNSMRRESIVEIAEKFDGIVVIDEAYIDFSAEPSFLCELHDFPNVVVLQTFSKAWGMAGLRVGMAFASAGIVNLMNRVKPPYNVSGIAQRTVMEAFADRKKIDEWTAAAVDERRILAGNLAALGFVEKIYASDANFLLVKVTDAEAIYRFLLASHIVVRNRNNIELCDGCLRITVGTPDENVLLIRALGQFEKFGNEGV